MSRAFYALVKAFFAIPRTVAIREVVLNLERANRPGPLILAVSHLSHTEPIFVSCNVKRQVRWMARVEHYQGVLGRTFLNACGAFSVDRFGNPAPAVRQAIRLLRAGEVIGIFPEGGNAIGRDSVLRNSPIKGGVATIAIAASAPVIPVVVLGTHKLNQTRPWLPTKSGRVWIAFGNEVLPPQQGGSRRAKRNEMLPRIRDEFVRTYQSLLSGASLSDADFP
jgi:1-acyl-sn-glycerol-3-phosphate acyltransferase